MQDKKVTSIRPYIIFLLAALFYLYEYMLQIAPSVMTHELMTDLKIQSAGLGVISAFFYYAYTPMQLPAGLLFDRFGPRVLLTIAILVCACGALLFAATKTAYIAAAGRFLMGLGAAFSFIGVLVLVANWFPPKYFALFAGLTQLLGAMGAIAGETPLALLVNHYGWQETLLVVALIGVILAASVWYIVSDKPSQAPTVIKSAKEESIATSLKAVLGKRQTWAIALYSFAIWAPITIFAALWGVPYLMARFDVSSAVAASAIIMIWLGVGIGSPFAGWFSDRIGRRKLPLILCALIGLFASVWVLYIPNLSLTVIYIILFLFGLAAGGQSLIFAVVNDINTPDIAGTAIGFNNMCVVAGGALFQPLVGFVLNHVWQGQLKNGLPVYLTQDYQYALFLLPLSFLVAWLVAWFGLRETHCLLQYAKPT